MHALEPKCRRIPLTSCCYCYDDQRRVEIHKSAGVPAQTKERNGKPDQTARWLTRGRCGRDRKLLCVPSETNTTTTPMQKTTPTQKPHHKATYGEDVEVKRRRAWQGGEAETQTSRHKCKSRFPQQKRKKTTRRQTTKAFIQGTGPEASDKTPLPLQKDGPASEFDSGFRVSGFGLE